MDMYRYFICFVLYSFIGWLYESTYYTLRYRKPVNTGFLNGCFCPIYGIGALLDVAILGRIQNVWVLFLAGMVLTGSLEYFVSWVLEEIFDTRWWDYSAWPFNINGRVCLAAELAFGILSVLLIKVIHPAAISYIARMPERTIHFVCLITALILLMDLIMTVRHSEKFEKKLWFVNMGPGILTEGGWRKWSKRASLPMPKMPDLIKRLMDYINGR